ncbi:hypothetical protein CFC21_049169 [Triticum aestivum]|uniref:C2H2-type domain-containing protein n=2 Tax=Triticum aestivum TaxID=4565 RepID=A0A3B6GZL5_WHEAT|nr:uncharacterized protein LOC123075146 [Triticum aestivum]KAF7039111.1 hypothetical protein CFC21_049169 [Triticum aestivum]
MGTDRADQSRRRRPRPDLEEGEFVADDDDGGRVEIKVRRLEDILDGDALPSPTPSREGDSDGTVSDMDADDDEGLAREPGFPCPICRREFASGRAVHGHMRVHHPHGGGRQGIVVSGGWAVTGKRGYVGGRSVSVPPQDEEEEEGVGDSTSMTTAVAEPVIDAAPIAFASRTSSAEPNPPSMAIALAADNPPNQVGVRPSCSPQCGAGHQPAAPRAVVAQPQPAVAQGHLAAAAPTDFFASPPQAVARHVRRAAPSPTSRDEQGRWVCKEEGCYQRFNSHQGLGGHMAAHKMRKNNEAAAAAAAAGLNPCLASARPAKLHPCKHCPKVFNSGVQLGGHMRMHYEGKVIARRRRVEAPVSARELAAALFSAQASPETSTSASPPDGLALSLSPPADGPDELALSLSLSPPADAPDELALSLSLSPPADAPDELALSLSLSPPAPAATEVAQPGIISPVLSGGSEPAPAPVAPGVLRIFGVNIAVAAPAAAGEEVSSAVSETDQSSAASTNIQE